MKNAYTQQPLPHPALSEEIPESNTPMANDAGPSEWTIQKILGFSKSFQVRPSNVLGQFEQTLN